MTNRDSRGRFIPMTPDERVAAHVAKVNERHPQTGGGFDAQWGVTPWGTKRVITDAEVEAEHKRQANEILERWRVEQYAKVRSELDAKRAERHPDESPNPALYADSIARLNQQQQAANPYINWQDQNAAFPKPPYPNQPAPSP